MESLETVIAVMQTSAHCACAAHVHVIAHVHVHVHVYVLVVMQATPATLRAGAAVRYCMIRYDTVWRYAMKSFDDTL